MFLNPKKTFLDNEYLSKDVEELTADFLSYKAKNEALKISLILKNKNAEMRTRSLEKHVKELKTYSHSLESHIFDIKAQKELMDKSVLELQHQLDRKEEVTIWTLDNTKEEAKLPDNLKEIKNLYYDILNRIVALKEFQDSTKRNIAAFKLKDCKKDTEKRHVIRDFLKQSQNTHILLYLIAKSKLKIGRVDEALYFFEFSAMLGMKKAYKELSLIFYHGKGIEPNRGISRSWLLALEGNATALYQIGNCYYRGPLHQNFRKALFWYTKSADVGSWKAMQKIAWIHGYGYGNTLKNIVLAKEWFQKSIQREHELQTPLTIVENPGNSKNRQKTMRQFEKEELPQKV